jgi:hypothetical protein
MRIRPEAVSALLAHAASDAQFARELRVSPSRALATATYLSVADRQALSALGHDLGPTLMSSGVSASATQAYFGPQYSAMRPGFPLAGGIPVVQPDTLATAQPTSWSICVATGTKGRMDCDNHIDSMRDPPGAIGGVSPFPTTM